jgi:RNA polymerase sigma factor (sigma-70 family)
MGTGLDHLVTHLRRALEPAGLDDRELLDRFRRDRDADAFEALVRRHGPRVLAACRKVLPAAHDAEDAFQATFLTLVRDAAMIRDGSVGGWLAVVAHRTAVRLRKANARRKVVEGRAPAKREPGADLSWHEACSILHAELERLPARYRRVLVLCYLEGKSRDEAATELGLSATVVKGALERGRLRLRGRLKSRGVALSAGLLAVLREPAHAEVVPALVRQVVRAADGSTVRPAVAGGTLAAKGKWAVGLTVAAGLLIGILQVAPPRQASAEPPAGKTPPAEMKKEAPAPSTDAPKDDILPVTGRVDGPDRKPLAGAHVFVAGRSSRGPKAAERLEPVVVTDATGAFAVNVNRSKGDSYIIATAPGFGMEWSDVFSWKDNPSELALRLVKDVPITGRVVNTEGKPVAGVRVSPESVYVPKDNDLDKYLAGWKHGWRDVVATPQQRLYVSMDRLREPVTTDADGKFTVAGCGGERIVHLKFQGAGIATTSPYVLTRPGLDPKEFNAAAVEQMPPQFRIPGQPPTLFGPTIEFVAVPGKTIAGRVTDHDTGKPIAGVRVNTIFGFGDQAETVTDKDGRYQLEGVPKDRGYSVFAGHRDAGYLEAQGNATDAPGLEAIAIDVKMVKGVVVTGRVIDKQTGKGLRAGVRIIPLSGNKYFASKPGFDNARWDGTMKDAGDDGRFRVVTIPGLAVVTAQVHSTEKLNGDVLSPYRRAVPDPDHKDLFRKDGDEWIFNAADGTLEFLMVENACKVVEISEKGETTVELFADRGKTATIHIHDNDGKPVSGVIAAGITDHWPLTYGLKESTATVYALDPGAPRRLSFLHRERKLAGTLTVRGDEKDPVTAKLGPVGTVTGNFVDEDGAPLRGLDVALSWPDRVTSDLYRRLAEVGGPVRTDKDGRFRIENVVPGIPFRVQVTKGEWSYTGEPRIGRKQVDSGKALDLGTVKLRRVE